MLITNRWKSRDVNVPSRAGGGSSEANVGRPDLARVTAGVKDGTRTVYAGWVSPFEWPGEEFSCPQGYSGQESSPPRWCWGRLIPHRSNEP